MNSKTFAFVPSIPAASSEAILDADVGLRNSLSRWLQLKNWSPSLRNNDCPEILVVISRFSFGGGDRLCIGDLLRLHAAYGERRPRILLIDLHNAYPKSEPNPAPWIYLIQKPSFDDSEVDNWLNNTCLQEQTPINNCPPLPSISDMRKAILRHGVGIKSNGVGMPTFDDFLNKVAETYVRHGTTRDLLKAEKLWDFYYGLVRLNSRYGNFEHDLNKATESSDLAAGSLRQLGCVISAKRFLDGCHDLLLSLRHPIPEPQKQKEGPGTRNVILLVDDRPDLIAGDLKVLIKALIPQGYKLWKWGASNDDSSLKMTDLAHLSSWCTSTTPPVQEKEVEAQPDATINKPGGQDRPTEQLIPFDDETGQTRRLSPSDLFKQTAFVLVDFLFTAGDGQEKELGPSIMSGLVRLIQEVVLRSAKNKKDIVAPVVIGISRADDMDKVQACLQAGADGYVLKSRLLALPSVMGRNTRQYIARPVALHRNFRTLYHLPRETIGLLKSASVPPVDFSRGSPTSHPPAESALVAGLLCMMPKTDLHLHVGSCMSPEFLTTAALVMLAQENKAICGIVKAIPLLFEFWSGKSEIELDKVSLGKFDTSFFTGKDPVALIVDAIIMHLESETAKPEETRRIRSLLHARFRIRDHLDPDKAIAELKARPPADVMFFALAQWLQGQTPLIKLTSDDLRRLFVVFLATRQTPSMRLNLDDKTDLLTPFYSQNTSELTDLLNTLNIKFFAGGDVGSITAWRNSGWTLSNNTTVLPQLSACLKTTMPLDDAPSGGYTENPLGYMLASGTRAKNLADYLAGCEYQGAEFLRHPYLMHLYAQQVISYLVQHGVLYSELRAAANGFACEPIGFTFTDACACLQVAFTEAQRMGHESFCGNFERQRGWLWNCASTREQTLVALFDRKRAGYSRMRYPARVNLVLTGKRHKTSREMMREAAALVVVSAGAEIQQANLSAQDFCNGSRGGCRLVGFDLAGLEDGYPPALFRQQFEQLSRMHIPVTAHAGENASAEFVEGAVLDLRAERIGHGLAVAEDPALMDRVRENSVCLELCPVSNYQTNKFHPAGRSYPLKKLLENGNPICINTDNPSVSGTNIIKEYFQAAFAYNQKKGLPLWDVLGIMRMGFVHAFLSLPERRAFLELTDQIVFDMFTDEATVERLRTLVLVQTSE